MCARHFKPEDFEPDEKNLNAKGEVRNKPKLKRLAAPSLHLKPEPEPQPDVGVPEEDFQPVLQKPTKTYKKAKLKTYLKSDRKDESIPKPPVKTYSGKRTNKIVKSEPTDVVKIEPVDPLLI